MGKLSAFQFVYTFPDSLFVSGAAHSLGTQKGPDLLLRNESLRSPSVRLMDLRACCSSSVLQLGASASTFVLSSACAAVASLGGGVVRVLTLAPRPPEKSLPD